MTAKKTDKDEKIDETPEGQSPTHLAQPAAAPVSLVADADGVKRHVFHQDDGWEPAQVHATDEEIAAAAARNKEEK